MPKWSLIDSGAAPGRENMDLDERNFDAFDTAKADSPILHFYRWARPCVTIGYSINAEKTAQRGLLPQIEILKRITGGGCVLHDTDLAFSLILPVGFFGGIRKSYLELGRIFLFAFGGELGIKNLTLASRADKEDPAWCFAGADDYDIVCEDRKLCGIAQRRKRDKLIFQGSIQREAPGLEKFVRTQAEWGFFAERSVGFAELSPALGYGDLTRAITTGFSRLLNVEF